MTCHTKEELEDMLRDVVDALDLSDVILDENEPIEDIQAISTYLICNPHPLADMICQCARTGQPVYIRIDEHRLDGEWTGYQHYSTNTPDWNIPGAEYSFTPFEEEV